MELYTWGGYTRGIAVIESVPVCISICVRGSTGSGQSVPRGSRVVGLRTKFGVRGTGVSRIQDHYYVHTWVTLRKK